ncbi:hypothetical protein [Streptomyces sp. YIM 98790]|uniref:hypothetical protein n=1 Tax=Streptomyces sp. YIM 98790 TaxID=2689077 RepID=UPI00140A8448|nr:hypothetical protein [Streptomyces sp. YIM 98790]
MTEGKTEARTRRPLWPHAVALPVLAVVVWWAFRWQLSALQWLGLLLIVVVLWHAVQGRGRKRGRMGPAARSVAVGAVGTAVLATLPLDQPWRAPWFPGSGLAGSVPDPCAVAAARAEVLVPDAAGPDSGGYRDIATDQRTCGWQDERRLLYVTYRLFPWQGTNDTSVTSAERAFAERREHAEADSLPIGDEAYREAADATRTTIQARRANVVVDIKFYALDGAAPLTEAEDRDLRRLAEEAAAAVSTG